MLATAAVNGWPIETYRDADHPLQRVITTTFAELTGEVVNSVGVDGVEHRYSPPRSPAWLRHSATW